MKLRHSTQESPDVNLTPLIDVVFLLLIFFMVSTTFSQDAKLTIDLPEASAKPENKQQKHLALTIDAKGAYYLNGKALVNRQLQTLKSALRAAAAGETPPIIVTADANTPHQAVITVMDAASQLGLVRLSFATRFEEAGKP